MLTAGRKRTREDNGISCLRKFSKASAVKLTLGFVVAKREDIAPLAPAYAERFDKEAAVEAVLTSVCV